ncbi:MAG: hypothetical protein IKL68_01790 [Clostridia bacterium]|nr:hypothetical protein [Clostridia bacterium]
MNILIEWSKKDYINPLIIFKQSKIARLITDKVNILYDKKIINFNKKYLTVLKITTISFVLYLISIIILYSYIKVLSTSMILSIPFLISPLIISKILIERNKQIISKQIPFYAINIKNQIKDENNIIQAIKRARVEEPLARHINEFLTSVFNGANVISSFNKLKQDVDVKDFTELINSFEDCYKNGGDFVRVLEKYIIINTKERLQKTEMEEKAFSSIVTLVVMTFLNILVIITFVFGNAEYANIVRGTNAGRAILNLNAITYMLTSIIIFRVYKEE